MFDDELIFDEEENLIDAEDVIEETEDVVSDEFVSDEDVIGDEFVEARNESPCKKNLESVLESIPIIDEVDYEEDDDEEDYEEDDDEDYDDDLLDEETTISDEEIEEELKNEGFSFIEPITFSESDVRLFPRDDQYLLFESELQAVYNYYGGSIDGYGIISKIAETHQIAKNQIMVVISESDVDVPNVKINKGLIKKIDKSDNQQSTLQMQIAKLRKQMNKIPKASPSYQAKAKLLKRLRAKLILQK